MHSCYVFIYLGFTVCKNVSTILHSQLNYPVEADTPFKVGIKGSFFVINPALLPYVCKID